MKRISFVILLALCCVVIADAKKNPFGNGLYWELSTDGTLTISGKGRMPDFKLGKDAPWFKLLTKGKIKRVYFSEGIIRIGNKSFCLHVKENVYSWQRQDLTDYERYPRKANGLRALTECKFPSTLKEIGYCAFVGTGLLNIQLPQGLLLIETSAFENNYITSVELPSSLEKLSGFNGCRINNLTIPLGVKDIGWKAFAGNPIETVKIPQSVTSIGSDAFEDCRLLSKVILSKGIKSIGSGAFSGCNISSIYLPDGLVSIGYYVFARNPLTKIRIPRSLEKFDSHSFGDYEGLTQKTINAMITCLPISIMNSSTPQKHAGLSPKSVEQYNNGIHSASGDLIMVAPDGKKLSKEDITVLGKKYYKVKITDKGYTYLEKFQLITEDGKDVLGGEFDELTQTKGSLFKVKKNGYYGMKDINGKEIIPLSRNYTSLSNYDSSKNRFSYAMVGYKGECDGQGRELSRVKVVPPKPKVPSTSTSAPLSNAASVMASTKTNAPYYDSADDVLYYVSCDENGRVSENGAVLIFNFDGKKGCELTDLFIINPYSSNGREWTSVTDVKRMLQSDINYYENKIENADYSLTYKSGNTYTGYTSTEYVAPNGGEVMYSENHTFEFSSDRSLLYQTVEKSSFNMLTSTSPSKYTDKTIYKKVEKSFFKVGRSRLSEAQNNRSGRSGNNVSYSPSLNRQNNVSTSSGVGGSTTRRNGSSSNISSDRKEKVRRTCAACNGKKEIVREDGSVPLYGASKNKKRCYKCGKEYWEGTFHRHQACPTCHGKGYVEYWL